MKICALIALLCLVVQNVAANTYWGGCRTDEECADNILLLIGAVIFLIVVITTWCIYRYCKFRRDYGRSPFICCCPR